MTNQTGQRADTRAIGWCVSLLVAAIGAQGTATAGAEDNTYRWDGELVALTDDGGQGQLTVTSRVVTRDGLAGVDRLQTGDPIVITWSGFGSRASGIRSVARCDGTGVMDTDRFLLPAEFVSAGQVSRYLTFRVTPPADDSGLERLQAGMWATATSPHWPFAAVSPTVAMDAYEPARRRGPLALDEASYRWNGEVVEVDPSRGPTLRSRIVSSRGRADVDGLRAGDPIVIAWSGADHQAHGVRAVSRCDGANVLEQDQFLLPARFVSADPAGQYLTFSVTPPADDLARVRAMTRGAWATITSPHQPASRADAVMAVDRYLPVPAYQAAGPALADDATYQWHGELVTLDEQAGTSARLTVKSRIVTRAGLEAAQRMQAGERIVLTWSGFEDRANGVRSVARFDGSGLWGSDRFLLPAEFVAVDAERQYVTFAVTPPADSLPVVRTLTRGSWATLTSPHRPTKADASVLMVDAYDHGQRDRLARTSPVDGVYRWHGELVSFDDSAAATVTIRSRVVTTDALASAAALQAGDPIVITWSGVESLANGIRAVVRNDGAGLWGSDGFLLPATLVALDRASGYLTFAVTPPASARARLRVLPEGTWTTAVSPHWPQSQAEAVTAIDAYDPARRAQRDLLPDNDHNVQN